MMEAIDAGGTGATMPARRRPKRHARRVAAVGLVAMTLGLGACSSSKDASNTASLSGPSATVAAPQGKLGAPAAGGDGVGAGPQAEGASFKVDALGQAPTQQVGSFISTASMTIKVESVAESKPKVIAATQALGGGLFGEQTTMGEQSKSVITVKVAPEKFAQLLKDLAGLGTLASEEVKTEDVTQQVIDLDARIKASESSLERTRLLLDQAKTLVEVSQLENEIARRQADVESLRGQKVTLETKINLSTVVVTLIGENDATPAVAEKKEEEQKPAELPGFMDGLSGGVKVGSNVGTVVLAGLGALVPFVPVFLLIGLGIRLIRRNQRKRPAPAPAQATSATWNP